MTAVPTPRLSPRALVATHLAIFPAGGAQAAYGPSLPAVAERFSATIGTVGLLIGAHGAGSFVGIVLWAVVQRRLGLHRVAAASAAALGVGTLLLASAPTWPLMVLGAGLTGAGFGGLSVGTNVYVSSRLGDRSTPVLTSIAAVFGLGSIAAPVLLGWLGPADHRLVFAALAIAALLACPLLVASEPAAPAAAAGRGARRPSPVALLFMVVLGLYASLEVSIGGWQATHLVGLGYDAAAAARWTATFWIAFTIGRMAATPLAARVSVVTLSLGAIVAATVALATTLAGAAIAPLAVVGYVAAGLAMAPVFPATFAWFSRVTSGTAVATALFFVSGSVGAAVVPPIIGSVADRFGTSAIPPSLLVVACVCALALLRARITAPPISRPPTASRQRGGQYASPSGGH